MIVASLPATSPLDLWTHIFGEQTGTLCVTSWLRRDKLTGIRDEYFVWPDDAHEADQYAEKQAAAGREVFFVPTLLRAKSRKKDAAGPMTALWVDGDDAGITLPPTIPEPTAVVASSPHRRHWYWKLGEPVNPDVGERLNQRLALAIGADRGGADATQLLRVPAGRNFKYPDTPLVTVEHIAPTQYRLEEIDRVLPRLPSAYQLYECDDFDDEPPVRLNADGLLLWEGERVVHCADDPERVDRSRTLWAIAKTLGEAGATRPTIVTALQDRDRRFAADGIFDEPKAAERHDDWYTNTATSALAACLSPSATTPVISRPTSPPLAASSGAYAVLSPDDLLTDTAQDDALVEGILYPGTITLISAWVGTGKTTLAMDLVLALQTQTLAFGLLNVGACDGSIVCFTELPKQSVASLVRRTARAYGLPASDILKRLTFVDMVEGRSLDKSVQREFMALSDGKPLVIVDTFDHWLGADPNKTENAVAGYSFLKNVASTGTSVLVFDHQGKSQMGQDKRQSAVAGSSAKQRHANLVYRLDRPADGEIGDYRDLVAVKDREGHGINLRLRYQGGRYRGEELYDRF